MRFINYFLSAQMYRIWNHSPSVFLLSFKSFIVLEIGMEKTRKKGIVSNAGHKRLSTGI